MVVKIVPLHGTIFVLVNEIVPSVLLYYDRSAIVSLAGQCDFNLALIHAESRLIFVYVFHSLTNDDATQPFARTQWLHLACHSCIGDFSPGNECDKFSHSILSMVTSEPLQRNEVTVSMTLVSFCLDFTTSHH